LRHSGKKTTNEGQEFGAGLIPNRVDVGRRPCQSWPQDRATSADRLLFEDNRWAGAHSIDGYVATGDGDAVAGAAKDEAAPRHPQPG
jgi:hypothetical protein